MPVIVLRHAHAVARSEWEGDDRDRVLSRRGVKQSRLLAKMLVEMKPARILTSPYVRCLDTVRPLAAATGLEVEEEERLAEGHGRAAIELTRALGAAGEDAVLCSHGDVIPDILAAVANEDGVDLGPAPQVEKASIWVLHGDGGRFSSATYIKPPKT